MLKDSEPPLPQKKPNTQSRINTYRDWAREWRRYDRLLPTAFLFGVLCYLIYALTIAPPSQFPGESYLKIEKGASLSDVAAELKQRQLIRSTTLFMWAAKFWGATTTVESGEYFFPSAETTITVAKRLVRADRELTPVRVTIPEGVNVYQIAGLLAQKVPDFDKQGFIAAAQSNEGYLFPDTYFFLPGEDPLAVLTSLESNFKRQIASEMVVDDLKNFNKPLPDVITMASLLEKEASDSHNRRIIAGILWHRLAIGMPLQVDAVFPYIIGKNSLQLTHADLKTNSPYNTYINKGLPPGPIANPGLDSIIAAVTPIKTNYLYYLSDLHGNFHYSVTYAQQLAYQKQYLK